MEHYKDIAYRFEGLGLKLTKFHQLRHWYFYISMYGVPCNFDSSFCESHHIYLTKRTGRRTQKWQDDLAMQTAMRVYEANLLSHAIQHSQQRRMSKVKMHRKKKKRNRRTLRGAKFTIAFDYSSADDDVRNDFLAGNNRQTMNLNALFDMLPKVTFTWYQKRNVSKRKFPDLIMSSIHQKLAWFNNGNMSRRISSINGYTELRLRRGLSHQNEHRDIVRAHPDYRGKGLWCDWIDVEWEVEGSDDSSNDTCVTILPAQVVMILDFHSASFESIPDDIISFYPAIHQGLFDKTHSKRDGVHLLIHSTADDDVRNVDEEQESIATRFNMEPYFQLIQLENVAGLAFVARDPPHVSENRAGMDFRITRVMMRNKWGSLFVTHFKRGYEKPKPDEYHLDKFNLELNPW